MPDEYRTRLVDSKYSVNFYGNKSCQSCHCGRWNCEFCHLLIHFLWLQCHFSKGSSILIIHVLSFIFLLCFVNISYTVWIWFYYFTQSSRNPSFVFGSCSREPGEGETVFKTSLHNSDKFITGSVGIIIKKYIIEIISK